MVRLKRASTAEIAYRIRKKLAAVEDSDGWIKVSIADVTAFVCVCLSAVCVADLRGSAANHPVPACSFPQTLLYS
ncbi:MAG: hypothetical protein JW836_16735 [Deltaproteobacteria bacterium]|nr:hypothetical protein [Deltaproteobacteria bacterium]